MMLFAGFESILTFQKIIFELQLLINVFNIKFLILYIFYINITNINIKIESTR